MAQTGRAFAQVDVFSRVPFGGNPVAVVLDAEGLDDAAMAAFARWTNLSETTFLLPPTPQGREAGADYRLRIFTPGGELTFAGHPTLGSAHAWLEAGGRPHDSDGVRLVQECGAGLVTLRRAQDLMWFAAPPLVRSGPVSATELMRVLRYLRVDSSRVRSAAWVDNGPGWLGVLLDSASTVLGLTPDPSIDPRVPVGVVGLHAGRGSAGAPTVEVRAFVPSVGIPEDPVTGSLNASLAQWLVPVGVLPPRYVAAQGTVLHRAGRVHLEVETVPPGQAGSAGTAGTSRGTVTWVGGATTTLITGSVDLGASPVPALAPTPP